MNAQLLKTSFSLIQPQDFAQAFYLRLFQKHPDLRLLFVQDLTIQERSLAATLHMIVQAAEHKEDLSPSMYRLGQRHVLYGVKPEHYPLLQAVLLETFSALLGEQFTPEMHLAWAETYENISVEMRSAAIK